MDDMAPGSPLPHDTARHETVAHGAAPAHGLPHADGTADPHGIPRPEQHAASYPPPRDRPLASGARLGRLLWVLGLLVVLLVGPNVVSRFRYAASYGREKARVDAAREALGEIDVEGLSTVFRMVAQSVEPSVVHIQTARRSGSGATGDEWAYLFGEPPRYESQGTGSGVVVDEAGYIVTNHHVVAGGHEIRVQLSDGRQVDAEVLGVDVLTDLAVLKVDASPLIAAPWGDSTALEVGDMVWAVGSPFGLEKSVTFGIVSAKGRRRTSNQFQNFLQTDAAVNPGNSGGPLVNLRGELVGINTAIVGGSYRGISFAIPSEIAADVYRRIRSEGKVARGWLGVALQALTPEMAGALGLEEASGVLAREVVPDSPAAAAGLQRGDVIVAFDGSRVDSPTALSRAVAATRIGSRVDMRVIREGNEVTLPVVIGERPLQL